MRSPGAADTVTGAKQNTKSKSQQRNTKESAAPQDAGAVSAAYGARATPSSAALDAQALGVAGRAIYEVIKVCSDPYQLDEMGRLLWKGYSESSIGEGEATYLSSIIELRRPLGHRTAPGHTAPLARMGGRLWSRFTPRQRPRSPDRKASRDRRLRHYYTEGQRAVLCIVTGEVKHHGICDLPIDEIAALAGVSRTSVQTTMHEARRLGHIKITERPQRGRKSLTNVVEIILPAWRAWIRRGPSTHRPIGSNFLNLVSTTKNTELRKEGASDDALSALSEQEAELHDCKVLLRDERSVGARGAGKIGDQPHEPETPVAGVA
jgi:hypothetical protein